MRAELQDVLESLSRVYGRLDDADRRLLLDTLTNIAEVASQVRDPDEPNKLRPVARYTASRLKGSRRLGEHEQVVSLRAFRNQLVHQGGSSLSPSELRRYSSALWRALERSAEEWNSVEIYNILAYCMGEVQSGVNPQMTNAMGVIKSYKLLFVGLDKSRQERCLKELVMRLYSYPKFINILEHR
jgi:hypothetical protein